MPAPRKIKKTLKGACWVAGLTVAELCRELGISRQTAYHAWVKPQAYPIASPKITKRLNQKNEIKDNAIAC